MNLSKEVMYSTAKALKDLLVAGGELSNELKGHFERYAITKDVDPEFAIWLGGVMHYDPELPGGFKTEAVGDWALYKEDDGLSAIYGRIERSFSKIKDIPTTRSINTHINRLANEVLCINDKITYYLESSMEANSGTLWSLCFYISMNDICKLLLSHFDGYLKMYEGDMPNGVKANMAAIKRAREGIDSILGLLPTPILPKYSIQFNPEVNEMNTPEVTVNPHKAIVDHELTNLANLIEMIKSCDDDIIRANLAVTMQEAMDKIIVNESASNDKLDGYIDRYNRYVINGRCDSFTRRR